MADFEPGDIVQIKSGGPLMTVVKTDESGVLCLWFNEATGEVRTATIPTIVLGVVDLADDEDLEDDDLDDDEDEDEEEAPKPKRGRR